MGQAWCKEKTSKAQDSKSPLDRVFVRCAHRIYPGLKEEGSVLGGATQRVTSSEIGYAGSPPREALTRGRSIDSVDRPFHPSDWVDVNLEVPSTPRASSVLTNLTVDTSLYPATTPTSSCSNLKDVTPVPPPRRKKRNKGRPLPPKPDEIPENSAGNLKRADGNEEPLYSSVKSPKTSGDEQDAEEEARTDESCSNAEDTKNEGRRAKEIYKHKVNGTGKIISSDVVSGRRTSTPEDKKTCRNSETSQHPKKDEGNEEYESFARDQLVEDSSTPNRQDRRKPKDLEIQIKDSSRDSESPGVNVRTKNYSTVSLPNYDELDVARHQTRRTKDDGGGGEKTKSRRPVRSSTGSLPAESFLSPFSEKTSVRLEDYIPRRGGSADILSSYQVLGKLNCSENGVVDGGFAKYDPSKLEDWDLGDVGNCELNHHGRLSFESPTMPKIDLEKRFCASGDVVDFAPGPKIGDRGGRSSAERETSGGNVTGSPVPLQKPETFGKTPSPVPREMEDSRVGQNRSQSRYFDPPTLAGTCGTSPTPESTYAAVSREPFYLDETKHRSALDTIGGSCRNGAISEESDRSEQSRMIFGRSLSNESEPSEDAYEAKELRGHRDVTSNLIRTISEESLPREMVEGQDGRDEFFEERLAKDARDNARKDRPEEKVRTPPPSPEPRIKAEIQDNDHSTLLNVLKEEAADESNLSSMTPSLTELEAALSDMLEREEREEREEKEDSREEIGKGEDKVGAGKTPCQASRYTGKFIEPDIVPVEKNPASFKGEKVAEETIGDAATIETQGGTSDKILVDEDIEESTDEVSVSLGQILEERKPIAKGRKVSFCAWEETGMAEIDLRNDREFIGRPADLDKRAVSHPKDRRMGGGMEEAVERISASPVLATPDDNTSYVACPTDFPPEKPSRLHRNPDDSTEHTETSVPTPPRRKHKGSFLVAKGEIESAQNGSRNYKQIVDPYHNDRLI